MPWKPSDATRHTKKATTPIAKRQFADVANSVLEKTGDEGRAVREANAAVAKRHQGEPMHPHDPYSRRK
jgi:D-aminopeptidase